VSHTRRMEDLRNLFGMLAVIGMVFLYVGDVLSVMRRNRRQAQRDRAIIRVVRG
jgi:hypothetical protein